MYNKEDRKPKTVFDMMQAELNEKCLNITTLSPSFDAILGGFILFFFRSHF
jgi:hypothetical protein